MVRNFTVRAPSAVGYRVLVAETPEMALSLFAQAAGEVDLLLTDVVMPQTSGKALSDRIASRAAAFWTVRLPAARFPRLTRHDRQGRGAGRTER